MLRTLLEDVTVCAIKRKVPYHSDVWWKGLRGGDNRFGATAKGLPLQYIIKCRGNPLWLPLWTHFEALRVTWVSSLKLCTQKPCFDAYGVCAAWRLGSINKPAKASSLHLRWRSRVFRWGGEKEVSRHPWLSPIWVKIWISIADLGQNGKAFPKRFTVSLKNYIN